MEKNFWDRNAKIYDKFIKKRRVRIRTDVFADPPGG